MNNKSMLKRAVNETALRIDLELRFLEREDVLGPKLL